MRKVLFGFAIASFASPALSAPPLMFTWADADAQKDAGDYMKCVGDTALSAGMDHKEVPAADVVNAAATKCPDWQVTDMILRLQWDTYRMKHGLRSLGLSAAEVEIQKWRDDWFKDIAGQLTAKRLGM